jgi:hypothetical protein
MLRLTPAAEPDLPEVAALSNQAFRGAPFWRRPRISRGRRARL